MIQYAYQLHGRNYFSSWTWIDFSANEVLIQRLGKKVNNPQKHVNLEIETIQHLRLREHASVESIKVSRCSLTKYVDSLC